MSDHIDRRLREFMESVDACMEGDGFPLPPGVKDAALTDIDAMAAALDALAAELEAAKAGAEWHAVENLERAESAEAALEQTRAALREIAGTRVRLASVDRAKEDTA